MQERPRGRTRRGPVPALQRHAHVAPKRSEVEDPRQPPERRAAWFVSLRQIRNRLGAERRADPQVLDERRRRGLRGVAEDRAQRRHCRVGAPEVLASRQCRPQPVGNGARHPVPRSQRSASSAAVALAEAPVVGDGREVFREPPPVGRPRDDGDAAVRGPAEQRGGGRTARGGRSGAHRRRLEEVAPALLHDAAVRDDRDARPAAEVDDAVARQERVELQLVDGSADARVAPHLAEVAREVVGHPHVAAQARVPGLLERAPRAGARRVGHAHVALDAEAADFGPDHQSIGMVGGDGRRREVEE